MPADPAAPRTQYHRVPLAVFLALLATGVGVMLGPAVVADPGRTSAWHRGTVLLADSTPTPAPATGAPAPSVTAIPGEADSMPPIVVGPTESDGPSTAPPDGEDGGDPSKEDDPGTFDVIGKVKKAINDWFRDLVNDTLHPVLSVLGHTLLATPDVATNARLRHIWGTNAAIANAVFVLFVAAGGAIVLNHETLQTSYALKDITPRLFVGFITANASISLVHQMIVFANALAQALLGQKVTPDVVEALLVTLILKKLTTGGIFTILLCLVAAILALVLLVTYLVRVSLVILLTAAAPLALVCHALPHTEGLARLWWRALIGCFAVQLGQALVLITGVKVLFDGGHGVGLGIAAGWLIDLLMALVLLFIMLRIPVWVGRHVLAGTPARRSTLVSLAKAAVVYKGLSLYRGRMGHATGGTPAGRDTRSSSRGTAHPIVGAAPAGPAARVRSRPGAPVGSSPRNAHSPTAATGGTMPREEPRQATGTGWPPTHTPSNNHGGHRGGPTSAGKSIEQRAMDRSTTAQGHRTPSSTGWPSPSARADGDAAEQRLRSRWSQRTPVPPTPHKSPRMAQAPASRARVTPPPQMAAPPPAVRGTNSPTPAAARRVKPAKPVERRPPDGSS